MKHCIILALLNVFQAKRNERKNVAFCRFIGLLYTVFPSNFVVRRLQIISVEAKTSDHIACKRPLTVIGES